MAGARIFTLERFHAQIMFKSCYIMIRSSVHYEQRFMFFAAMRCCIPVGVLHSTVAPQTLVDISCVLLSELLVVLSVFCSAGLLPHRSGCFIRCAFHGCFAHCKEVACIVLVLVQCCCSSCCCCCGGGGDEQTESQRADGDNSFYTSRYFPCETSARRARELLRYI